MQEERELAQVEDRLVRDPAMPIGGAPARCRARRPCARAAVPRRRAPIPLPPARGTGASAAPIPASAARRRRAGAAGRRARQGAARVPRRSSTRVARIAVSGVTPSGGGHRWTSTDAPRTGCDGLPDHVMRRVAAPLHECPIADAPSTIAERGHGARDGIVLRHGSRRAAGHPARAGRESRARGRARRDHRRARSSPTRC